MPSSFRVQRTRPRCGPTAVVPEECRPSKPACGQALAGDGNVPRAGGDGRALAVAVPHPVSSATIASAATAGFMSRRLGGNPVGDSYRALTADYVAAHVAWYPEPGGIRHG